MTTLLLILQIFIVVMLVLVIILQKTSADGLSGLAGGGNSMISSRTSNNFFTKMTVFFAIAFTLNSFTMAKIEANKTIKAQKLIQNIEQQLDKEEHEQYAMPQAPIAE